MQQSGPVLIKKYPNRRLYDTSAGRYVNLDDLAALIRQGNAIQVADARTGEDLTRLILTQIIAEDAKGQPGGLPLELLRQLILISDRAGQEFLMWYLRSAFDTYQKVQETVQTKLNDVRSAALAPLSAVKSLFGAPAGSEVEELRRRVAELEGQLNRPSPPPKRRRRAKA